MNITTVNTAGVKRKSMDQSQEEIKIHSPYFNTLEKAVTNNLFRFYNIYRDKSIEFKGFEDDYFILI